MSDNRETDGLVNEGVVLSASSFIMTKESILLSNNIKVLPADIADVYVQDNKRKVNTGRWIAIILISAAIFISDCVRKGYVDDADLFLVPLVVGGITWLATAGVRRSSLIIDTASGDQHVLATIDDQDVSLEDLHRWCGIISATGVDWKSN